MIYRDRLKRSTDVVVSLIALVILAPVILLGWIAVKLASRGPGYFGQTRVGLGGREFRIHKLRTMVVDPDRGLKQTTGSDPDVLPVGRLLRRWKLDELPQIFNVLAGDMSLVGPRPCLPITAIDMPEWARRRFAVRPGLTGLAQINGNVSIPWEERWRHDVAYVEGCSFALDLKIIAKTFAVIVLGEDRFGRAA